jgi:hypothetical protein
VLIRIDGVTVEHGLTIATLEDAWLISAMIDAARRTIVMARAALWVKRPWDVWVDSTECKRWSPMKHRPPV